MIDFNLVQVRLYKFKPEPYLTENSFIPFQGLLKKIGFTIFLTSVCFHKLILFRLQEVQRKGITILFKVLSM